MFPGIFPFEPLFGDSVPAWIILKASVWFPIENDAEESPVFMPTNLGLNTGGKAQVNSYAMGAVKKLFDGGNDYGRGRVARSGSIGNPVPVSIRPYVPCY